MAGINKTYITILKRYMVEINDSKNYRKYLKQLLQKRLPNVKFVPSVRKNEAEKIVLSGTISKSIELHSAYHDDGKRNEEIDKVIDVTCQVLVQNARSDRQVKHQPKEDSEFMQTVDTPLSIGLPLAIHSRVRDKNLVTNLYDVYTGSNYRNLLEDTPTGQNTFHGTVIVLNQRAEDGDPVHQPLVIPTKIPSKAIGFAVSYQQQPIIKPKPIRFASNTLGKREQLVSNDYTRTWALANYDAIDNTGKSLHESAQVLDVEMQSFEEEGEEEQEVAEEERAKDKEEEEGK
ncbi:predicted protein [Nematostella vectensis]|uniref:Uncharacterized protein n=1 Tax=Nematostella vectensis TaxID=45351 RepID=A7RJG7_NEMVE|nr:predicted protein [Nematostella vectensis]|eukprot:XP_001640323.1 predicted protein [Nematostella vectensis]